MLGNLGAQRWLGENERRELLTFSKTQNPKKIPKTTKENFNGISKNERIPTPPKNDKSKIGIIFVATIGPVRRRELDLLTYPRLYSAPDAHGQEKL